LRALRVTETVEGVRKREVITGFYRTQGKWLRRGERRGVKWVEAMEW
jgi:hypothetical protein